MRFSPFVSRETELFEAAELVPQLGEQEANANDQCGAR
jgi:hypothetical protein